MSEKIKNADLEIWVTRELWFMRGTGIALILIAIVSVFQGILYNPTDSPEVNVFNFILVVAMISLGAAALIWTLNRNRIYRMVDNLSLQSPTRSMTVAAVQGFFGAIFLLEAIGRGRISVWLLSALMIVSAFWYVQRANNIKKYQENFDNIDLFAE